MVQIVQQLAVQRFKVDLFLKNLIGFVPCLLVLCVLIFRNAFALKWQLMWVLSLTIYASVKWMTWWFCKQQAPTAKVFGYLVLWPGLDARQFLSNNPTCERPSVQSWLRAFGRITLGVICLWLLPGLIINTSPATAAWSGMLGVVLILHFGIFDLLSCFWRRQGVCASPLMNHPLRSKSLSEFWGKRWNTAFRDLTNQFLFRPLSKKFSPFGALLIAFLFSGLIHDLVVSLPAGGGYGLPTLYFLIQAQGMVFERSRRGQQLGLMHGWAGWIFTACVLLVPSPLLFHQPFLQNIVLPMLQDIRAL